MFNIYYQAIKIRARQNGISLEKAKVLLIINDTVKVQKKFLFNVENFYCIGIIKGSSVAIWRVSSLEKAKKQVYLI